MVGQNIIQETIQQRQLSDAYICLAIGVPSDGVRRTSKLVHKRFPFYYGRESVKIHEY